MTSTPNLNILVVRVEISDDRQVRIILCYSPQESATIEEREEFYTELSIEISRSISVGDYPMNVGNLNAKIKENEEGNVEALSPNGILLKEIIDENILEVVNFSSKCLGKWTHEIRTSKRRSVLDYIIVDKDMWKI